MISSMATTPENNRDELERFKRDINLTEYASHLGYAIETRESSNQSIAMRRPSDNDKVIVARNTNGHWIYFSVRNDLDNGTIIDFHQHRSGDHLGATRGALRSFMGLESPRRSASSAFVQTVEPTPPRNQNALDIELRNAQPVSSHAWLLTDRAIGKEILSAPRFTGQVRGAGRGNVLFPHFDERGRYSGSEIRNRGFRGFSSGGEKGLWASNGMPEDTSLVVCESAIDCLSHFALFPDVRQDTRYLSTGGAWNPKTPALLKKSVEQHPGQLVVLSFDNDDQGQAYTDDAKTLLAELVKQLGKELFVSTPANFKDWNEELTNERRRDSAINV